MLQVKRHLFLRWRVAVFLSRCAIDPVSEMAVAGSEDDAFDDVEENLPRAVVAAVEECYQDAINKGHPEYADILVFASTEQEIRDLQETLYKFGPKHTEILPLYARLALGEQQKIFNPSGKGDDILPPMWPKLR